MAGSLFLRTTVGGLMAGHGLQKLRGSFGGPGLEGTEEMMRSLDMHPAKYQALAAALSETLGGGLTAAGWLSPLGPAMITGVMAVAIQKVHAKNGPWVTKGGYEYNLILMAAAFAVAADGPGAISLDFLLGKRRSGLRWGIFQLALGLASAAGTLAVAERYASRQHEQSIVTTNGAVPGADTAAGAAPTGRTAGTGQSA